MNIQDKKIGIWGFGCVGKAVAKFLLMHSNSTIEVMNKEEPNSIDKAWLKNNKISLCSEGNELFFTHNDLIIPSPGIDIRQYYENYKNKWLTEVDLFDMYFNKPIIAITGTVGKTTITHILEKLLNAYNYKAKTCGNIGTAMLGIIEKQNEIDCAVIEVSSFQLEHAQKFAPDLAIITNISPNHLDRHSMPEYIAAKINIMAHQSKKQKALVPINLVEQIRIKNKPLHIFTAKPLSTEEQRLVQENDVIFFIHNNIIIKKNGDIETNIIHMDQLPPITFIQNWLIICSALEILGCNLEKITEYIQYISLPEHRMERIACNIPNISFINDSKSTTIESTLAAIQSLKDNQVILFIGGLSKGVDRAGLIKALPKNIKKVYCFGHEHKQLSDTCITYGIPSYAFATLSEAFTACTQHITMGDSVLLSPAGSSYDEFKNYEERGRHFKNLVKELDNAHTKQNKQ